MRTSAFLATLLVGVAATAQPTPTERKAPFETSTPLPTKAPPPDPLDALFAPTPDQLRAYALMELEEAGFQMLHSRSISVDKDRKVTISGHVDTEAARDRLLGTLKRLRGVASVDATLLSVPGPPRAELPVLDVVATSKMKITPEELATPALLERLKIQLRHTATPREQQNTKLVVGPNHTPRDAQYGKDGAAQYRLLVEHTGTCSVTPAPKIGVIRRDGYLVPKGKQIIQVAGSDLLPAGAEKAYELDWRMTLVLTKQFEIKYSLLKWDGTKYTPMGTWAGKVAQASKPVPTIIATSEPLLANKPQPNCPLEIKEAQQIAFERIGPELEKWLRPPTPDFHHSVPTAIQAKVLEPAKFTTAARAGDKAGGKAADQVPVRIELHNTTAWPVFELDYRIESNLGAFEGGVKLDRLLLPGEKRELELTTKQRWRVGPPPKAGAPAPGIGQPVPPAKMPADPGTIRVEVLQAVFTLTGLKSEQK